MTRTEAQHDHATDGRGPQAPGPAAFPGFDGLEANFLLCPNQFLDLCLPRCSRGAARIVGYLLRQTLGWLDAHGNPMHEQVLVSYQQLIRHAGVSRGALRAALDEAERAGFIRCVRAPQAKAAGQQAVTALYELRWDESGEYGETLDDFQGFYAGGGRFTPLPNQFFDLVLPTESHSVTKVVGTVLRHTVGFETRFGGRRQQTPLSYSRIQRHSGISRSTLTAAMAHALNTGYIRRLQCGSFSADKTQQETSIYGVRWNADTLPSPIGSEIEPGQTVYRFKNRTRGSVQKSNQDRFKNRTRIGSKIEPEDRFKNRTNRNTTEEIHSETQQQQAAADEAVTILQQAGFDPTAAEDLAARREIDCIRRQVGWIDERQPRKRLAMLRRAIEEDWSAPEQPIELELGPAQVGPGPDFAAAFYAACGGHGQEALAVLSHDDCRAAEHTLQRLRPVNDRDQAPTELGRSFGRFYRDATSERPVVHLSLARALRTHGDRFYAKLQQASGTRTKRQREADREAHEAAHQAAYRAYLAEAEARLRTTSPSDYERFKRQRADNREQVATQRFARKLVPKLLEHHDSEEGRLSDFARFFPDRVLDFWAWDTEHNPKAFCS